MSWRRVISLGLIVLFALVFIPQLGNIADVVGAVRKGQPRWLLVALALQLVWFLNQTALYQALYQLLKLPARTLRLLPIVLASNFVNFATPTASLGAVPLFLEDARQRGLDPGRVTLTNMLRLLLNLVWFSIPLVFSLGVLYLGHRLKVYHVVAASILLASTVLMAGGIVIAGLRPDSFARLLVSTAGFVNRASRRVVKRDVMGQDKAGEFACRFGEAAVVLWEGRRHLLRPLIHTAMYDVLELGVLYAMYMAFPGPQSIGLVRLVAGYSVGVLFSVVAITPQGLGVVEGTLVAAFTALGLPMGRAAVVMLAYRSLSFWLPLLAGFAALRWVRGVGRPTAGEQPEADGGTIARMEPEREG